MDYVLLLRGINVGGHRKVVMATLKAQLSAAGFSDVISYINSGNLIFKSSAENVDEVVEAVLTQNYEFPIGFTVISQPTFLALAQQIPVYWDENDQLRHNVLFKLNDYLPEYDQRITAQLTPYDQVKIVSNCFFWSSPTKVNYSRAFYAKMLGEPFYSVVSIRNRNTFLKLKQLLIARQNSSHGS